MWPSRSRWNRAPRAAAAGAGALIVCAMLFGSCMTPVARAAIGACGSDPIVVLSNGTELEFSTVIADLDTDVQQVSYTLHVPRGVQVVLSIAGALGAKEQWTVVPDMPAQAYEATTFVSAGSSGGAVTFAVQALGLIGTALDAMAGQVDQDLSVRLTL